MQKYKFGKTQIEGTGTLQLFSKQYAMNIEHQIINQ